MRPFLHIPLLSLILVFGQAMAGDIPWDSLSQEQQRILHRAQDRWDELPTHRQKRLLRGAQRWQHMDDDEREHARERWKERREHHREEHREQWRDRHQHD